MAGAGRGRIGAILPVTLLSVTLVVLLVTEFVGGQSAVRNQPSSVSSRSSRTKEASRPSYNTTLTSRSTGKPRYPPPSPAAAATTVPPQNIVTPSSVKITTTVTGGRVNAGLPPKQQPRPAAVLGAGDADESQNDGSEEEYDEEEDEAEETESQVDDEMLKPLSTRPPLGSVVTPPMPAVPLQTIFTVSAAGGEPAAVCIAVKAGIRFTFSYVNVSSGKIERGVVDLPARNYSTDGECGQTRQRISLLFVPDRHVSPTAAIESGIAWNLTIVFVRNDSDIYADQMSLRYVISTGQLPFPWSVDARMTAVLKQPGLFRTPAEGHSFICMSDAGYGNFVMIADGSNAGPVSSMAKRSVAASDGITPGTNQTVQLDLVELYNLQLQAFLKPLPTGADGRPTPTVSFSTQVIQCSGDFISIRVPVMVGVALLLFVVTVVIVYMVRRLMHGKNVDEKNKPVDYHPVP